MSISEIGRRIEQAMNEAERRAEEVDTPLACCLHCGGSGMLPYHWSISASSHGLSRVRCLFCQPKPVDPWKFHS